MWRCRADVAALWRKVENRGGGTRGTSEDLDAQTADLLTIAENGVAQQIFGQLERHLRLIEDAWPVRLTARGNQVRVEGPTEARQQAAEVLRRLEERIERGETVSEREVQTVLRAVQAGEPEAEHTSLLVTARGKTIRPK